MSDNNPVCPLCQAETIPFYADKFFSCKQCKGILRPQHDFPTADAERERYLSHNNDPEDPRYQEFVRPIVDAIRRDFTSASKGLDFGAGSGPVITKLLREAGFDVALYDPFFHPDKTPLEEQYDFIACCEVIEHFHHPFEEFVRLKSLLHEGGKLYVMTHLYDDSIPFANWYYKNDSTHVFIFRKESMEWIQQALGFQKLHIEGRLITFTK